jgi:hypothetical protein
LSFSKTFLRAKILVGRAETKVFNSLKMIALTETRVAAVETKVGKTKTMVT